MLRYVPSDLWGFQRWCDRACFSTQYCYAYYGLTGDLCTKGFNTTYTGRQAPHGMLRDLQRSPGGVERLVVTYRNASWSAIRLQRRGSTAEQWQRRLGLAAVDSGRGTRWQRLLAGGTRMQRRVGGNWFTTSGRRRWNDSGTQLGFFCLERYIAI